MMMMMMMMMMMIIMKIDPHYWSQVKVTYVPRRLPGFGFDILKYYPTYQTIKQQCPTVRVPCLSELTITELMM